jgi:uncharacterized protein YndB with AHSA1/START domain
MSTKVSIDSTIAKGAEKVWAYYNKPEHITQWNFASNDWHCPRSENDVRVGGKMKTRMEAKDGSFGFDFEATYDEVVPQKRIAYTMPDGRKVVTTFEAVGLHTKVTTVFDAENQHPVDFQKAGWQAILDNFRKYAESRD